MNGARFFAPKRLFAGWRCGPLTVGLSGKDIHGALKYEVRCSCGVVFCRSGREMRLAKKRGHNSACDQCCREAARQRAYQWPRIKKARAIKYRMGEIGIELTAPLFLAFPGF
jgi:hypothetical protein